MAEKVIASKLAACVQLAEIQSHYQWQGECQQEKEFRLEMKTKQKLYKRVEVFILKEHSYDTPEILCIPIKKVSVSYSQWIEDVLN